MDGELGKFQGETRKGLEAAFNSKRRLASTALLSSLLFLSFALSTDISWHLQTIQLGVSHWGDTVMNGIATLMIEGKLGFALTILYSVLGGAALTNTFTQLKIGGLNLTGAGSILPGFLAAGCASCGVGIASLVGLAGATAALPFGGIGVKAAGVMLIIYAIGSIGDPRTCKV